MKENKQKTDNLLIQHKSRWDKYLTKKEVTNIVQACKINVQRISEIKSGKIINDEEYTTNVHVKIRNNDGVIEDCKVIISFRLGPPTWEQFIRITYRSGSNAGIRIIIHEGDGYERDYFNDPAGNVGLIGDLVYNNNKCGVETYLIEAKGLIQRVSKGKAQQITYNLEHGPNFSYFPVEMKELLQNIPDGNAKQTIHGLENIPTSNDNPPQQLPSLRQVQESEFWTCYYLVHWNQSDYEPMGLYGEREEWAPRHSSLCKDLSSLAIWNDDGLHINLVGDQDSELIKLIWENNLDDFKKGYPDVKVELMEKSGTPYGISTRILNLPMKNLIKMGPRKKMFYGDFVYEAEHVFSEFIDGIIVDLKNMGKIQE